MNVTQQVMNILQNSYQARNSDRELLILYMQREGLDLNARQIQAFRRMPSFETIRRVRQKLQEQGKYEADPIVKRERSHKAMVMGQASPVYKPENIEKTLDINVLPWGEG